MPSMYNRKGIDMNTQKPKLLRWFNLYVRDGMRILENVYANTGKAEPLPKNMDEDLTKQKDGESKYFIMPMHAPSLKSIENDPEYEGMQSIGIDWRTLFSDYDEVERRILKPGTSNFEIEQSHVQAVIERLWTATIRDVQALMVRPINEALIRQGYLEDFKREFDKQASADHWYLGKVAINVDSTECVDFLLKSDLGLLCSKVLFQYAADQGCVKCLDLLYRHLWNSPHSTRSVDDIKRLLEVALFFALKNDSYDAAGFILNKLKQSTNQ
ncbi:hypothetical protein CYMTET_44594 [Cymbomonas tetramitiformis]|uniref:Uncharacterized protein n=1 Tax=Cymbomonas tetramitiformis TaxID=36881 RepID=A0AAE0BZQ8_9CHLO|nr:hypothetical protein CYMTET_44594 [Cymbomonas tetramitiformis]